MTDRPDTTGLLSDVGDFVRRYVVLQGDHFYDAIALWILHAHAIKAFDTSPRLLFKSPEKECGKTRGLDAVSSLTPNPLFVLNATTPAIFRLLGQETATVFLDEADAIWSRKGADKHEDLRALLNAGHLRNATVARVVGEGRKMGVKRFPVFAATALAAIGDLPDTIESRSIVIPMRRRSPDEDIASFRRRRVEGEAGSLREALGKWAEVCVDVLSAAEPEMPEGVTDRAADCWDPLLAIADLADGDWPQRARDAAQDIVAGRVAEDQSVGVRLLVDIRTALVGLDRISSADLVVRLNSQEEAGWGAWHDGKGISQRDLAGRLKPHGIVPKVTRMPDGSTPRAYEREQFADAWSRYLRDDLSATSATERNASLYSKNGSVADVEVERGRERRDAPQQSLPFLPETSSTSATSATTNSKPVADRGRNGSGPPHDGALVDAAYELDETVGAVIDAEAAALAEELA